MLKAVQGDITKITGVDAIVNAANKTLLGGGGVDGAIHKAAGMGLKLECMKLKGCKTGEAKITGAHKLPFQFIIHTVGPIWHGGNGNEETALSQCYYSSMRLAKENGVRKIAFPSISTGVYHFPAQLAAQIAIRTVGNFLKENPGSFELVEWVLFDQNTWDIYNREIKYYYKES